MILNPKLFSSNGFLGRFSLGVEPVDHDVLKKPPRRVTDPMIDRKLILSIVTSAVVIVIGTLCVFYAEVCAARKSVLLNDCLSHLDARRQSDTTRYDHDIHMFRLFRYVQCSELPISSNPFIVPFDPSTMILYLDEIHF